MELLYVWIESYDPNEYEKTDFITDQEVNITKEYDISYCNSTLYINKNENEISLFPSIIKSCNAIIGQNGAGKTTFTKMLMETLSFTYADVKKILVFKIEENIKVYSNLSNDKLLNTDEYELLTEEEYKCFKEKMDVIYYSPSFNPYYKWYGLISPIWIDISTNHLLRFGSKQKKEEGINKEAYNILAYKDLIKIKNFIFDSKLNLETLNFDKPYKLKLELFTNSRRYISENHKLYAPYYKTIDKLSKEKKGNKVVILSFITGLILKDYKIKNIYKRLDDYLKDNSFSYKKEYINGLKEIFNDRSKLYNDFTELIKIIDNDKNFKISNKDISKIVDILMDNIGNKTKLNIKDTLKLLNELNFIDHKDYDGKEKPSDYIIKAYIDNNDNLDTILTLLDYPLIQEIFQVSWAYDKGLSAGQDVILTMYARFYELFKNILKQKENIIIFLDEPDLYLHPSWKRVFFNDFIKFLEIVAKDKKIQLFITTNDPYIVSDLPKNNIIFLKNETGECNIVDSDEFSETFGTNIHTLLTKSFFMPDGVIGEFSKNKIKQSLKELEYFRINLNDYISDKVMINTDQNENIEEYLYRKLKEKDLKSDSKAINLSLDKKEQVLSKLVIKLNKEYEPLINIMGEPIVKRVMKNLLDDINFMLKKISLSKLNTQCKMKEIDNQLNHYKEMVSRLEELKAKQVKK